MTIMRVGIVDYDICNLNSVIKAFQEICVEVKIIRTKYDMLDCSHLVLPGVGSFQKGIENLNNLNLIDIILEWNKNGKPLLGICLGMQLLAETGYEFTKTNGLGIMKGKVIKIKSDDVNFILPHVGWNSVQVRESETLMKGIEINNSFYFVHSFGYEDENLDYVTGISDYFTSIVSVIEKDNVFGVQFHPEKSQKRGLLLLKNFTDFKC